jgi:hypothetical protein
MASKRRADKHESPTPTEPVRAVAVAVPAPGRFDRLLARLKTLKGAIVAIAGVGGALRVAGRCAAQWRQNSDQCAVGGYDDECAALVGEF